MSTALVGRKEIQGFVGRSWEHIMKWWKEDGFPMRKIDGIWESDQVLITEWRRRKIGEAG